VELGVHLPLMELGDEGQSLARIAAATDAARELGFAAVSANDHFFFERPWLDGLSALAAVAGRAGPLELATTIALVTLRGPMPLAKALEGLDLLGGGRLLAGVGPGSSARDYEAAGVPFEERWPRFEAATAELRERLRELGTDVPLWIGSWGSPAGLRRVARLADGWLASAYNTDPATFAAARTNLADELERHGRASPRFPSAIATMWSWITDSEREGERVLRDVLGPLLRRDPDTLRGQVCVGPPQRSAELLARYADAGCGRVYLWPLGEEPRQLELAATHLAT